MYVYILIAEVKDVRVNSARRAMHAKPRNSKLILTSALNPPTLDFSQQYDIAKREFSRVTLDNHRY